FPFSESAERYGIVRISVAHLRRQPVYAAEILNQLLLGEVVPVFESQNGYFFVQMKDGYRGWVTTLSLCVVEENEAREWLESATAQVRARYSAATASEDPESEIVSDLVLGARVIPLHQARQSTLIRLPDGQEALVATADLNSLKDAPPAPLNAAAILKTARRFLGIPYLWGGTSTKAFDCSGLVQTVFRLHHLELPRDASQMYHVGKSLDIDAAFSQLRPGDLLFFGKSLRRITHVALSLGGSEYIHAEGWVKYNSLDPQSPIYNTEKGQTFIAAKRILE
ncbi:MAG: C40 family peptidase, partial [Calditrichaeota bacterium]|nr:C40 family peptidase [Calditrichota bacterium]